MAEERVQRKLAAILAADVVGYSRLMGVDETGTRERVNLQLDDIIKPAIEEHRGRLVKTMGDGFLVEFGSVVDAVQCATLIQHRAALNETGEDDHRKMQLRIGIHLGDVIIEGDDIHGDGVNIAARLEGLAEPGGICVSDMVHAGVRNKLALSFDDLGEQSLKNIADPLQVFSIELGKATAAGNVTNATGSFSRPAVAVLPFENMSGESDQDYFVDGLTDDIITALSMFRSIPVIARNSTFGYKGQSPDIRNVGKELGARYIVEGSVRKAGSRVRVTCQLINAETGHHVWAERYDRELEDIFALQDEISQSIAAIIEPTLERAEEQRTVTNPPSSLAAWDYCARGNAHIWEWTKTDNETARDMFNRAIELDPHFARAYVGLAFSYARELRFFDPLDKEKCQTRLFESARRAVSLDELNAQARVVLALAYAMTQQPDAAVAEAKRAVELNPYDAAVNNCRGLTLSLSAARFEEGIPYTEMALQQNPLDPNNQLYMTQLALAQLCVGRHQEAVEQAQKAIRRRHDFLEAHLVLASAFGYLGRPEEAQIAIEGYQDVAENYIDEHVVFAPEVKHCLLDGLRQAGLME